MINKTLVLLALVALIAQPVLAQTLIPATSEDISEFDRQVAEQIKKSAGSKSDKAKTNFGSEISAEAKKLKDSDQGKDFGKWVSGQRKKADQGRPSAAGGGAGAGQGSTAPGKSGSSPGKGKNKNR